MGIRLRNRPPVASASGAVAVALALAACGSSGVAASSTVVGASSSGSASSAGAQCQTVARERLAAGMTPMKFAAPSQTVDAAKARGKTVYFIKSLSSPIEDGTYVGLAQAAKTVGIKTVAVNGNSNPTLYVQAISEAVNAGASVIILQGISPSLVAQPLRAAIAKGVKVIDAANGSFNTPLGHLYAHVSADFQAAGALDVDYALATAGCESAIGLIYGSAFEHDVDVRAGVQVELRRLCSACELTTVDVPLSQFTPQGVQLLASNLHRRAPGIKTFVTANDFLALYAFPPSAPGGAGVTVVSNNGDGENLQLLASGSGHQKADVSLPPANYIGWVALDYAIRAMVGAPAYPFPLPQQMLEKGNLNLTNPFPHIGNYQAAFKKLWRVD